MLLFLKEENNWNMPEGLAVLLGFLLGLVRLEVQISKQRPSRSLNSKNTIQSFRLTQVHKLE